MFLVQYVSYSVLWITFKFSMWCFQAMKKYVIYCNYKKTVVCWWNWVAIHVCKLNTERRWPQWSQVRFPSTIRCFFFSEGKTMQHSPFICTTWKGSMAQLPLVLVYHIPLQIATVWGVLRHLTSRWYNSYRLDVQLPFFSDAFYHIFFVG